MNRFVTDSDALEKVGTPDGSVCLPSRRISTAFMVGLLALLVLGARGELNEVSAELPGSRVAHTAIKAVLAGDISAVAALSHIPLSYTPEERRKDIDAVEKSLRFVLESTGRVLSAKPLTAEEKFYFISSGGGDNAYWESISPYGRAEFPYVVTFEKYGRGMVKPVVFLGGSNPGTELVGVEIGLPADTPGSKERLVELSLGMFERMGVATPPNIRSLIEQGMEGTLSAPARVK